MQKHSEGPNDYLDGLIDEKEAARFLGYTDRALQNWRLRGGGPMFMRISKRSVRYRRRDLIAWANSRLATSTSQETAVTDLLGSVGATSILR